MLELCEEAFDAPSLPIGKVIIAVLLATMPTWRDDGAAALFTNEDIHSVGIIGAISQNAVSLQALQQVASRSDVALLGRAEGKANRQSQRVDYRVEFAAETAAGAAKSLGLRSPLFRWAPAA